MLLGLVNESKTGHTTKSLGPFCHKKSPWQIVCREEKYQAIILSFRVVESFHQKSCIACLQMFLQGRGGCTSPRAMNRLSVCHDNQLPITKGVRLSKAIKWWNQIVYCRNSASSHAHAHTRMFLCGVSRRSICCVVLHLDVFLIF